MPINNGDNVHSSYCEEEKPKTGELARAPMPDSSKPQKETGKRIDQVSHLAIRHLLTQAD